MPFGKIEPFEIGVHNWDAYCRRIKQFIVLNAIKEELHVATLVTHVGVACYELICDLCAPELPEQKAFEELERIVKEHLEPKRSEIAERHVFRQRKQKEAEGINDYLQSLKHLAKTCNFGNTLEINLRDQFVSGLYLEDMRSRLFAERELDYKRAVELALALEAAERHAALSVSGAVGGRGGDGSGSTRASVGTSDGLHRVAPVGRTFQARPLAVVKNEYATTCTRCGKVGHSPARCRFKVYNCDNCGERGHLKVVCSNIKGDRPGSIKKNKGQLFFNNSDSDSEQNFFHFYDNKDNDEPYHVNLFVENKPLTFEIDTGSKISAISKLCYNELFSHIKIIQRVLRLKSYVGDVISPIGYITVNVQYKHMLQKLDLYVFEKGGPPLLGRTWIRCLCLNDMQCFNIQQENSLESLVEEFLKSPEVFANGLGTFKTPLKLYLTDSTPIFVKARPLPLALRGPVEKELDRLQKDDVIYKVERSDYGTPIVPVIKKNGDIRICGDYKITINPRIKSFHYPLPRIEDIFATLAGGEQYSKLDLSNAYQQLLLSKDSQAMTAITTHVGTFVYKRVPFGIKCIPENFQKIIEEILSGLPSTVVFQDDVCCTGKNRNEHFQNLRAVLARLKAAGLRVNLSKCDFFKDSVTYLGYRIDKEGLHTDDSKIEAIVAAPTPKDVTQLKSFLGLVNFYSKFCVNLSSTLKPLYELLKKNVKWKWNKQCDLAFDNIKKTLSSGPVLAHYDPALPLVLSVDSSSYGLGAVLAHRYPDGSERVVSCASRTLNAAEVNYSQLDKEALAIIFGVTKHHQYVFGRHFYLRSDHRPLSYIFGKNKGIPQTAASRLQRYAVRLAAYDFDIEFVPSNRNCFADALSRLPLDYPEKKCRDDYFIGSYLNFVADKLPITFEHVKHETSKDRQLNRIVGYVKFGWPDRANNDCDNIYFSKRDKLFVEHGCLVWGYRVVIPGSLRAVLLEEMHSGHLGVVKMKQVARNYVWWDGLDSDIERTCSQCGACNSQRECPPPAPLHSWPWPAEPWARLNIDFLGPFRGKYYLVIIDAHSKWLEVECVHSTSAQTVISCLRKIFARFGLPKSIVSDNGPPFSSSEYLSYLNTNGIRRILVAPYHPSSNGAAENAVRQVKQILKKAMVANEDLSVALCRFLFAYRNTEHSTTQKEPSVALLGHRLRGRLDLLRPHTAEIVRTKQEAQEERRGGCARPMLPGDPVLLRDYTRPDLKWKDGVVVSKTGPVSYKVKTNDDRICKRHVDQLLLKNTRKSRLSSSRFNDKDVDNTEGIIEETVGDVWSTPTKNITDLDMSEIVSNNVCSNDENVQSASTSDGSPETGIVKSPYRIHGPHKMILRPRVAK